MFRQQLHQKVVVNVPRMASIQRHLSNTDKDTIVEAMKRFSDQQVEVMRPVGDREAEVYAEELDAVLKRAGWRVQPLFASYEPPWEGVEVCLGPPAAQKLKELLHSTNVKLSAGHCGRNDNPKARTVLLEIGYGPN